MLPDTHAELRVRLEVNERIRAASSRWSPRAASLLFAVVLFVFIAVFVFVTDARTVVAADQNNVGCGGFPLVYETTITASGPVGDPCT